ncbi:GTP pyrophosphokinase [Janibacter sp. GS2]|uniref:GTP pyrophosphokinase n=1 Tax=Janibacter sp. GS2 TaxID=3442646 RepID=UPI003EBE6403
MTGTPDLSEEDVRQFARIREDFTRMMLGYRFGMEQVATRLDILREESAELHVDNPIEHISTRLKSPESIIAKAARQSVPLDIAALREGITDIAGIRVVCSFVADVYRLVDSLTAQPDITVRTVKDYIAAPKPNGYRSLHVIVEIPVFLSSGAVHVPVEVQFRTVAMDFWASTEHKIFYKYEGDVPADLRRRITDAAATAARMDDEMAELLRAVHGAAADTGRE